MNYELPVSSNTPILGKSLYIVGQALKGEVNRPYMVASEADAISIFGTVDESPLTKAYTQYVISGGATAYLVRTGATIATCVIKGSASNSTVNAIEIHSKEAGEIANNISINVTANSLVINNPYETDPAKNVFLYLDYTDMEDLCRYINTYHGKVMTAFVLNNLATVPSIQTENLGTITFSGGTNGLSLTKNQLYIEIQKTIELLISLPIDLICLVDMWFDDVIPTYYTNNIQYGTTYYFADRDYLDIDEVDGKAAFHKLMIEFCRTQAGLGIYTHCIMGMNKITDPIPETYDHADMIIKATAIGNGYGIRDYKPDKILDYGNYISVCYGDLKYRDGAANAFIANLYMTYAALWITSNYDESLTNKKLSNVKENITLADGVVEGLVNLGVITSKISPIYDLCIAAGVTQALTSSPFYLVANNKITQRCLSLLHLDLIKYLESPGEPVITNISISNVVKKSLDSRVSADKIITSYNHSISYNRNTGLTTINVELYTIYSIEKIVASTSI